MDCLRFEQLVQRYLDADLGPVHARLMDGHAAGCAPCGGTLREYAALFDALHGLQRDAAPPDLEAAVLARVDVRAFCPQPAERLRRLLAHPDDVLPIPAQMGLAAALVLGLLYAGSGRLEALAAALQQGLGRAATWTWGSVTGAFAESASTFLSEHWPLIRATSVALLNAARLIVAEQGQVLGLSMLAAAGLVFCILALRRARGGPHASVHLV